jgi:hypothetical protein
MRLAVTFLFCVVAPLASVHAQAVDPNLMREVTAVRAEVARSNAALRGYTWTEHTDVLVKGDVKSSSEMICRYDASGSLTKTPLGNSQTKRANPASNRPSVRKKADMQDYIKRATNRIHEYVPPKPEQIQHLLENGGASLMNSASGQSEIQFKDYFQTGDSVVFTYDSASKRLLKAAITSDLGSPKDPVTLEALFEPLPDGVNHLASANLSAPARKVEVKMRNIDYNKAQN